MEMDMRKYSSSVIMPADLHDGPRVEKIINISEKDTERYTCAVLEFEGGDSLYLWSSQARILNNAWGYDSTGWLGQELELSLGHYTDKKTNPPTEKEIIVVKPISPRKPGNGGAPSASSVSKPSSSGGPVSLRGNLDDEVPFAPEWR